jgi:hypothetical protein
MSAAPEQAAPLPPGSQTHVPATQALLLPVHSASVRQPGWQVLLAAQYSPLGQSSWTVHSTHWPLPALPRQISASPEQAAPLPPGSQTQTWLTQALLVPVHSLLARQPV